MNTAEILNAAADLIEPDGAWTRGAFARDAGGIECEPTAPAAVCWCMRGAISRVTGGDDDAYDLAYRALRNIIPPIRSGEPVAHWQDNRSRKHATIVRALRDAAKAASGV